MRRVLTITILILISFLLQTVIFPYDNLFGSSPDFLLMLTMSFGIMRGRREGLLVGFFGGLLIDIFYNSYLGPFAMLYMVIGYVNGFFHKDYTMEDILLPVVISFVDSLIFHFIVFFVTYLMRNRIEFGFYFVHIIMPQAIWTTVATAVLYRIVLSINRRLKKKAKKVKS